VKALFSEVITVIASPHRVHCSTCTCTNSSQMHADRGKVVYLFHLLLVANGWFLQDYCCYVDCVL